MKLYAIVERLAYVLLTICALGDLIEAPQSIPVLFYRIGIIVAMVMIMSIETIRLYNRAVRKVAHPPGSLKLGYLGVVLGCLLGKLFLQLACFTIVLLVCSFPSPGSNVEAIAGRYRLDRGSNWSTFRISDKSTNIQTKEFKTHFDYVIRVSVAPEDRRAYTLVVTNYGTAEIYLPLPLPASSYRRSSIEPKTPKPSRIPARWAFAL